MATRRPLTDTQREILQAERSSKRLEATRTQEIAAREAGHTEARARTEATLRRQRQVSAVQGQAVGAVASTATPSGDSNLVMVTIFTMAGLIIVYQLVTRGPAVSSFFGGLGEWMHTLSSNTPLFVNKK